MNKKGFTLVEILAVIAILGIVLLLVVPNLMSLFGDSKEKAFKLQEKEIKEAALIYLEDYCKNPLGGKVCSLSKSNSTFSGKVTLSYLESEELIDEVSFQDDTCEGCVIFNNSKPTVYLKCGERQTEGFSCN